MNRINENIMQSVLYISQNTFLLNLKNIQQSILFFCNLNNYLLAFDKMTAKNKKNGKLLVFFI